jgi:valyl-tRNA synthetase
MDEEYSRQVQEGFIHFFKSGHIYRGKRMVNWCPVSMTALSDEEVIMKPRRSKLYFIRYEIAGEEGEFLEIATTRPETLMGDSGVAVNAVPYPGMAGAGPSDFSAYRGRRQRCAGCHRAFLPAFKGARHL